MGELDLYYRTCGFPKTNRVVEDLKKDREADRVERKCRAKVNKRDGHRCFFPECKTRASDPHHVQPRSLGGKWTVSNILSSCRIHHDWFKAGLIRISGDPNKPPVKVHLTKLGEDAKIRVPARKKAA